MIIIRLMGGMGNQMFQYAMGRSLEIKGHGPVFYDDSSYTDDKFRNYALDSFCVTVKMASQSELDKYRRIRMIFYKIRQYVSIFSLYRLQRNLYHWLRALISDGTMPSGFVCRKITSQ